MIAEHPEYDKSLQDLLGEVDRVITHLYGMAYVAAGYPSLIYNLGRTSAYVIKLQLSAHAYVGKLPILT